MCKILLQLCVLLGSISIAQATEDVTPPQLKQIESLQRRAEKLAFGANGTNDYHLAKARAWLDMALDEYHEKDTSGTLFAAIGEAIALLDGLEQKQPGITMDTPVQIAGSEAVRPDLLDKISKLKRSIEFSCGQRTIATAEVYLVWAGHEFFESGQSHAASYMRRVENLIYDAQVAIDNCAAAAPAPAPAPHVMEKLTLSDNALFAFNKATLNPSALSRLNTFAESIKMAASLEEVILVGHTDRITSIRHPERNQILSEQRADSIKQYLVGRGIPADKIHANGAGSSQPIVQCSNQPSMTKQIACLQPNRRVEILLRGTKAVVTNVAR